MLNIQKKVIKSGQMKESEYFIICMNIQEYEARLTLTLGYELFSGANLFETSPYMSRLRPRVLMIFNKWGHQCSKFKNKLSNMPGHAIFLKDCMKNCVRLARNKSKSKTLTDTKESSFLRTFQR